MSTSTTVKDNGYNALMQRLTRAGAGGVTVGIHDSAGDHSGGGLTVAEVGAMHEFSIPREPPGPRSFLSAWVDKNEKAINSAISRIGQKIVKNMITPEQGLGQLGDFAVGGIKQRIQSRIPPELSDARKAQKVRAGKSGDTPLIDTGQLISSITYQVTGS